MKQIFFACAALFLLSSCQIFGGKKVRGNGNIISQQRQTGNFTNLDVEGAVTVRLKQDQATTVRVETDENLLEYLEISVSGNTLHIEPKDGYNLSPSNKVTVFVSAPEFKEIDLSGASELTSEGVINGNEMRLEASGASEITMQVKLSEFTSNLSGATTLKLTGTASKFSTDASGASKIQCLGLSTDQSTLDLSGASEAAVTAEKELNIEASGASTVEYRGNANINQRSSGASNVRKIS
ncbi:MAG TPA: head GIN domain-containing protein [Flavisolibacter sp.]|nr:head GIN domain-containing protein [Flavisolibacter sp.]